MCKTNVNHLPQRILLSLLLVLSMFIALAPTAHATPDTDSEPLSRVIVETTIPDGFSGTVYVMLSDDTGAFYTVMCNKMSDYKGSLQLPYGEYYVERAYTSEDNLSYEAFIETESFVLNEVYQRLFVTVKYNAAGVEPEEPIIPGSVSTEPDVSAEPIEPDISEAPDEPAPDVSQDELSDPSVSAPGQNEEPEQGKSGLRILRDIVVTVIAIGIFVGAVCAVVYYVRKKPF